MGLSLVCVQANIWVVATPGIDPMDSHLSSICANTTSWAGVVRQLADSKQECYFVVHASSQIGTSAVALV